MIDSDNYYIAAGVICGTFYLLCGKMICNSFVNIVEVM